MPDINCRVVSHYHTIIIGEFEEETEDVLSLFDCVKVNIGILPDGHPVLNLMPIYMPISQQLIKKQFYKKDNHFCDLTTIVESKQLIAMYIKVTKKESQIEIPVKKKLIIS